METLNDIEISPQTVQNHLDTLILIDVREDSEWAIGHIATAHHLPLGTLPQTITPFLECNKPLIFICHKGMRSLKALAWLKEQGVKNCYSMKGGMAAWSATIDTSIPQY
jgi:sulfur-carrier protein adenylyltransferase/sulfurtransferase